MVGKKRLEYQELSDFSVLHGLHPAIHWSYDLVVGMLLNKERARKQLSFVVGSGVGLAQSDQSVGYDMFLAMADTEDEAEAMEQATNAARHMARVMARRR